MESPFSEAEQVRPDICDPIRYFWGGFLGILSKRMVHHIDAPGL